MMFRDNKMMDDNSPRHGCLIFLLIVIALGLIIMYASTGVGD